MLCWMTTCQPIKRNRTHCRDVNNVAAWTSDYVVVNWYPPMILEIAAGGDHHTIRTRSHTYSTTRPVDLVGLTLQV